MTKNKFDIKEAALAPIGRKKIEWAASQMPVLKLIEKDLSKGKPFKGIRIGACLHVTSETAVLMITLKNAGACVSLCASNPLSTQDEVAASLVCDFDIPVFAVHGEDNDTYYRHLQNVLDTHLNITMDDGGDLINELHKLKIKREKLKTYIENDAGEWEFYGSSEETTTGVIRLKAVERNKALKVSVIAVNDSDTKHLFDNRYGTGQSTIDGILRATNILLAGKRAVVCGYGWCGRGIASRLRGMGAVVTVVEVDPVKALEAVMDGFLVDKIENTALYAQLYVTATGNKKVISTDIIKRMKDGAILCNSGHFNVEIDYKGLGTIASSKRLLRANLEEFTLKNGKRICVLGEGRLVNLACAEGHPASVMDMSFANQALSVKFFMENLGKLAPKVYTLPQEIDNRVATLKLASMGIVTDVLSREQKDYLESYSEGT